MVERWNATVRQDDEIWHLGDVALGLSDQQIEALLGGCTAASIS